MTGPVRVVVEADGGARGNPGPAAYGAVLRDADTGEVLAERGEAIGVATNNVAEYRGLIAGLELAREHAPDAQVEARLDSKLVVEQMAGNWKVKNADLRTLHARAAELAPPGTVFTWVPRDRNKAADLLVNEALDGLRDAGGPIASGPSVSTSTRTSARTEVGEEPRAEEKPPDRGWSPPGGPPTNLLLVRHGVTEHTALKRFSGGLKGGNPSLTDEGRAQVRATGEWLGPVAEAVDMVVTSPVRRTLESAEILAELWGVDLEVEDAIAEMEFGTWDGLTFAEVQERYPDELQSWLGNLEHAPGGGESFAAVAERVRSGRDRIVDSYAGHTVVVVSHVTPIKTIVADAVGAPLEALFRMELSPASVTAVSYFEGHPDEGGLHPNLRLYNARPTEGPGLSL